MLLKWQKTVKAIILLFLLCTLLSCGSERQEKSDGTAQEEAAFLELTLEQMEEIFAEKTGEVAGKWKVCMMKEKGNFTAALLAPDRCSGSMASKFRFESMGALYRIYAGIYMVSGEEYFGGRVAYRCVE